MSPGSSPSTFARMARRRIFAERVFGSSSTNLIDDGLKALPSSSAITSCDLVRQLVGRFHAGPQDAEAPHCRAFDLVRDPDGRAFDHRWMIDRRRLVLGRADPLPGDVQRVVRPAVEEPVAIVVDGGPVAMHPHVWRSATSRCRGTAVLSPQKPRVIAGHGCVHTSSPTSPRTGLPSASKTSIAMPSDGVPSEQTFVGITGHCPRKQAPTSVPPDRFMIGHRPPPTTSENHR